MIRDTILKLNNDISNKAGEIQLSLESDFKKLTYGGLQVSNKKPLTSFKPLIWFGGGGVIVGLMGMFISDSVRTWQVLLTCAGGLSLGYGSMKTACNSHSSKNTMDFSSIKNFYVEEAEKIVVNASKKWDSYIASQNNYLVGEINKFVKDERVRSKILYKTYYLESVKISIMDFVNSLDGIPHNGSFLESCVSAKMNFLKSVKRSVESAAKKQTSQYNEIISILESNGI